MPKFIPYEKGSFPGLSIPKVNVVVVPTLITIFSEGKQIGFVTDLTYDSTRRAERIRHCNFADAGRIIEQVPSPTDFTLRCTGFCLYASSLLSRIAGGATGQEDAARIPSEADAGTLANHPDWLNSYLFTIEEVIRHPNSSKASGGMKYGYIYGDCVVTDFSHPMSRANMIISETVTLQPTWVKPTIDPSGVEDLDVAIPISE